ncbi:RNA-binding protein 48-like [Uloborus diversus]|uniref:RNA-binding protein 48-like n=1 Tax=Uloborus diversus TaxID=327109 RepID=UPI00240A74E6|nr:RNA-binding protein 48-like [Uloborus diversus]
MEYFKTFSSISVCPHHVKQDVCQTRAKYREGKEKTAVKVYTVNQESMYIIISDVPAVGGCDQLRALCDSYGVVEEFQVLDEYPSEEFTEAFLVKFDSFLAAKTAKRHLDEESFLGGLLHVFYAPEFETPAETSLKLQKRRKYIAWKTKSSVPGASTSSHNSTVNKKTNCSSSSNGNSAVQQPVTYVWAGKEYTVYPNPAPETSNDSQPQEKKAKTITSFLPRQIKTDNVSDRSINQSSSSLKKENASFESCPGSSAVEKSYLNTMSHVRAKITEVSVPNVRVSFKRRKRM